MAKHVIYTLGHNGRSFDEFLAILKKFGIQVVVDVRRYPLSKLPWFTREYLEKVLPMHGISYVCYTALGALGIARKVQPFPDIVCTSSPTYRAYVTYLLTNPEARSCIEQLIEIAREKKTCLMCRERFPWRCHRNYLSDVLKVLGMEIVHILDIDRVVIHRGTQCYNYIETKIGTLWSRGIGRSSM